ncbi:hypothetical protein BTURTLESOX_421 [bacterium endosymbiont of Bathymodiolus sp. 5 South]|nr:hypothetical protein BTURTLESOX_421 [bacterium endosymbiont of Bathymodiolus sp. 5 South]
MCSRLTTTATASGGCNINAISVIITVFKVGGIKDKFSVTQTEFSLIFLCATGNRKIYSSFVGSKTNLLLFVFRHRNIARVGNLKRAYFFCIYNLDRKVVSPMPIIAITNSDDDRYISNISDGILSFDFITVDDFKIIAVGGKSKGITISIWIGSTESTNQKAGILVIGKNDLTIDNGGTVDLDIGRGLIV